MEGDLAKTVTHLWEIVDSNLSEDSRVIPGIQSCWTLNQEIKCKSNFKSPYVQFLRYYRGRIELGKGTGAASELKTAKASSHQEVGVNTPSWQPYTSLGIPVCLGPGDSMRPNLVYAITCQPDSNSIQLCSDMCLSGEWKNFQRKDVKTKSTWTGISQNHKRILPRIILQYW